MSLISSKSLLCALANLEDTQHPGAHGFQGQEVPSELSFEPELRHKFKFLTVPSQAQPTFLLGFSLTVVCVPFPRVLP